MKMQDNEPTRTGQSPLLDDAPCDCDNASVSKFIHDLTPFALSLRGPVKICSVARAVCLGLIGAAMVNPINADESDRAEVVKAALAVADAYESIARGIRRRVRQ